jgi:predicted DNA-binding protein (UPF0251 family)
VARPPIERAITGLPPATLFKPAGVPGRDLEQLPLAMDELEAMRLVDLEGLSHGEAAAAMGVSRQTVGRVLGSARAQVTEALVSGKAILIGGGQYRLEPRTLCCRACKTAWLPGAADPAQISCPSCGSTDIGTCWRAEAPCCASQDGGCDKRGKRAPAEASASDQPTRESESP